MIDFTTIDEYIAQQPEDVRGILEKVRAVIKQTAPGAAETISYGMPTFKLKGKNLVHFAAFPHHIGFYPDPSGITAFQAELSSFQTSKGAVQFPLDKPIPYELIEKITQFRIDEVSNTKKSEETDS
jgi:uncharacterized protein YdhG (YjbR/CyaY superfamily)